MEYINNVIPKKLKFWIRIMIGLSILSMYHVVALVLHFTRNTIYFYANQTTHYTIAYVSFLLLFLVHAYILICMVASKYEYRKQYILIHCFFILVMAINYISLDIIKDAYSLTLGNDMTFNLYQVYQAYYVSYPFIILSTVMGVIAVVSYTVISIYMNIWNKEESQKLQELSKTEIKYISYIYVVVFIVMFGLIQVKNIYVDQTITIDLQEEERLPIEVCGYNGYGYICGKNKSNLVNQMYNVAHSINYFKVYDRQAIILDKLLSVDSIYTVKDNHNGTLRNGDIVEVSITSSEKRIRLDNATTYKIEVQGLEEVEVFGYQDLHASQIQTINEQMYLYAQTLVNNHKLTLIGSKQDIEIEENVSFELIKSGYVSFLDDTLKVNLQTIEYNKKVDYNFQAYQSVEKLKPTQALVSMFLIQDNKENYIVEVYYNISEDTVEVNQDSIYYVAYKQSKQKQYEQFGKMHHVQWLSGGIRK